MAEYTDIHERLILSSDHGKTLGQQTARAGHLEVLQWKDGSKRVSKTNPGMQSVKFIHREGTVWTICIIRLLRVLHWKIREWDKRSSEILALFVRVSLNELAQILLVIHILLVSTVVS
jgi:hypothetical protein